MFRKQLKYDFLFAGRMFVWMGILFLGVGLLGWLLGLLQLWGDGNNFAMFGVMQFMGLGMTIASVITVIQMFHLYNRQCFGSHGHLMLTLPVGRGVQLISKYIVALFWGAYTIVIIMLSMYLLTINIEGSDFGIISPDGSTMSGISVLGPITMIVFTGFAGIALLFFMITLMHSVFRGWQVHVAAALGVGVALLVLLIRIGTFLSARHREWVTRITQGWIDTPTGPVYGTSSRSFWQHEIGLHVGRIPVGDGFLDIYLVGAMLAFGLVMAGLTYWLLCKKITV